MKKVLFSLALVVAGSAAFAQVNKGQWLVGGNVGFNSTSRDLGSVEIKNTSFDFKPNAGYFFIDQLAGGLRVNFGTDKAKGSKATNEILVAPFARYYFLPASQKVNVFADASYGFGSVKQDKSYGVNEYSIMAGPAVFLTPNTALEFAVGYDSKGGEAFKVGDDVKRLNNFGVNVGFQIHLGNAKK